MRGQTFELGVISRKQRLGIVANRIVEIDLMERRRRERGANSGDEVAPFVRHVEAVQLAFHYQRSAVGIVDCRLLAELGHDDTGEVLDEVSVCMNYGLRFNVPISGAT